MGTKCSGTEVGDSRASRGCRSESQQKQPVFVLRGFEKKASNSRTTTSGALSVFFFIDNPCGAPSIATSFLRAGINLIAFSSSSIEPKVSLVPLMKRVGVRRLGKCAVRNCAGRPGGCNGYDSSNKPSTSDGSSATNMLAWRPPYELPLRNARPVNRFFINSTARRSPA